MNATTLTTDASARYLRERAAAETLSHRCRPLAPGTADHRRPGWLATSQPVDLARALKPGRGAQERTSAWIGLKRCGCV